MSKMQKKTAARAQPIRPPTKSVELGKNTKKVAGGDMGGNRPGDKSIYGNEAVNEAVKKNPKLLDMAKKDREGFHLLAMMLSSAHQAVTAGLDALTPELLKSMKPDTLLRFAFSPEDMETLDLEGEHNALSEVRDTLTVNNPTPALMEALIKSGQFEDVIWSGHGDAKGMWITGADGKAELLPAKSIGEMFQDSSVKEIFLAACKSAGDVDDELSKAGVDTAGYKNAVSDQEAINDGVEFAAKGDLDDVEMSSNGEKHTGQLGRTANRVGSFFGDAKDFALGGLDRIFGTKERNISLMKGPKLNAGLGFFGVKAAALEPTKSIPKGPSPNFLASFLGPGGN